MGFAEKIITSQKKQIYKICERTDSGEKVWFIVHVFKHKLSTFLKIPKGQDYSVEDYGAILRWGYGDEVPEQVLEEIKNS